MTNNVKLTQFFKKHQITPKNYSYYLEALTHHSYSHSNGLNYDYQRLEFLGDAVIEMIVSEYLFKHFNKFDEGLLTQTRIQLVQAKTEIQAAKKIHLDEIIFLGESFKNQVISENILADCFEALVGAIYIDQGYQKAFHFVRNNLISYLDNKDLLVEIDYKSKFQEAMQKYGKKEITYKLTKNTNRFFEVELYCNGIKYGFGQANKIKDAEKLAAKSALEKLSIKE